MLIVARNIRAGGFRIDQAFVNAALLPSLRNVASVSGGTGRRSRPYALSDHAALLVDLGDSEARGTSAGS